MGKKMAMARKSEAPMVKSTPTPEQIAVSEQQRIEIQALEANFGRARVEVGDADMSVAHAEARRTEKRSACARADQALKDAVLRAAKDLGLDQSKDSWGFDAKTGNFIRRK